MLSNASTPNAPSAPYAYASTGFERTRSPSARSAYQSTAMSVSASEIDPENSSRSVNINPEIASQGWSVLAAARAVVFVTETGRFTSPSL
jgi:hypothetical protein